MMNRKKKLLSVLLCAVLVFAMVTPAFAEWELEPYISAVGSGPTRLNIYGTTGSSMKGRPLVLWTKIENSIDQFFTVEYNNYQGNPCMYLTRVQNGVVYAINRASYSVSGGHAAIMWPLATGKNDSAFKKPLAPDPDQLLILLSHNDRLAYQGEYSGATVLFGDGASSWIASGTPTL